MEPGERMGEEGQTGEGLRIIGVLGEKESL